MQIKLTTSLINSVIVIKHVKAIAFNYVCTSMNFTNLSPCSDVILSHFSCSFISLLTQHCRWHSNLVANFQKLKCIIVVGVWGSQTWWSWTLWTGFQTWGFGNPLRKVQTRWQWIHKDESNQFFWVTGIHIILTN